MKERRRNTGFFRKKTPIRAAALVVALILVALMGTLAVKYYTYQSYRVLNESTKEDTLSTKYQILGMNLLKYSMDGATLMNEEGKVLWTQGYDMKNPVVVRCLDTLAVYDKNGTNVVILNEKGVLGRVQTKRPIIRAKLAKQGVLGAILQGDSDTWIQYYNTDGTEIASIQSTMENSGYPMDFALSENGILMGVSYLQIQDGKPETNIVFYNFGDVGQSKKDNIVQEYRYEDTIIPQLEYIGADTCVAFRKDGILFFKGEQIPQESEQQKIKKEILSVFSGTGYAGVICRGMGEEKFSIRMYNAKGRLQYTKGFDFDYTGIAAGSQSLVLYNDRRICVFSNKGVQKFEGEFQGGKINQVFPASQSRCVIASEDGIREIEFY